MTLEEQLKQGYMEMAELNLQIAEEWFHVESEVDKLMLIK